MTSVTKTAQSCWAITVDGSQTITGTSSYYVTSPSNGNDLSGDTGSLIDMSSKCGYDYGFDKSWLITHKTDASNHLVTGHRFLPKLDADFKSPSGDYRFSPNNDKNVDGTAD